MKEERHRAQEALKASLQNKESVVIQGDAKTDLDVILENAENGKACLAVVITSLVKKIISPEQDIRLHQAGMNGGYSGRTLDTAVITPFLRDNKFPYMGSGSGWLTRSFEQSSPYSLDYKGKMKPITLKTAFLQTLNRVQKGQLNPDAALRYLFIGLIARRDSSSLLKVAKPTGLSIETIVHYLDAHFEYSYSGSGASRLPVLAIYAAYSRMMEEVGRYRAWALPPLMRHNAADTRTELIGDIQVVDEKKRIVEAVEVKHNIAITPAMIDTAYEKFKTQPVQRYYILTTDSRDQRIMGISEKITDIQRKCGCQLIVNGVEPTLKYYLRLLENPDTFIIAYAELLESDKDIKYEHKEAWNKIVSEGVR